MLVANNTICANKYIAVKFNSNHNKVIELGDTGIKLYRPDEWVERDDYGEIKLDEKTGTTKFGYNVDYKETHPQICVVTASNPKYPYKIGDKLFVHYMAYETAECGDIETLEAIIIADYVFFRINSDGTWDLSNDTYIGEAVLIGEDITNTGIILSLGKKDNLKVKITHIHKPYYKKNERYPELESMHLTYPICNIGDTVVSIDKYNYEFELDGKKYIKLSSHEIATVI